MRQLILYCHVMVCFLFPFISPFLPLLPMGCSELHLDLSVFVFFYISLYNFRVGVLSVYITWQSWLESSFFFPRTSNAFFLIMFYDHCSSPNVIKFLHQSFILVENQSDSAVSFHFNHQDKHSFKESEIMSVCLAVFYSLASFSVFKRPHAIVSFLSVSN